MMTQIELENPLVLASINFLGFGFDFSYGKTPEEHTFALVINFAFGHWSKIWAKVR